MLLTSRAASFLARYCLDHLGEPAIAYFERMAGGSSWALSVVLVDRLLGLEGLVLSSNGISGAGLTLLRLAPLLPDEKLLLFCLIASAIFISDRSDDVPEEGGSIEALELLEPGDLVGRRLDFRRADFIRELLVLEDLVAFQRLGSVAGE